MSGNVTSSVVGTSLGDAAAKWFLARNETHQAYSVDILVPQLIMAQAAVDPNAVAVAANNEVITYGELDARSNQIAHCLRSLGVGPDTLVGLYLDRSAMMVVAALGVLKSGGAYLPLDPACPLERLAFMLNDAEVAILLTQLRFGQKDPTSRWRTINLDADQSEIDRYSAGPVRSGVYHENLAYVIYTSGSTGQPKGVQITHANLLNLVFWHQRSFEVRPSDRASQLANPGFDAAVWEIWPYLTAGASVHLPDDAVRIQPACLRNWLVAKRITNAFIPTPLAERMLALEWPPQTALRIMLTGADVLHSYPPPGLPFTFVNNYGPTECTVVASSGTVPPDKASHTPPSIGRPIANTQIYILDEELRQVPIGTTGEIYIGGAGLARGYVNAPELTAARFISHPFSSEANARLYRTGDLAYYLPDGQIAFVGRIDEQLKIRGYRIEPNEIVTALGRHPMVQASVVVAQEEKPGEKRLLAYIVPQPGTKPTDEALRKFLSDLLPDYMIPSFFVPLGSLPVNASGKIDRGALPTPMEVDIQCGETYQSPHLLLEQRLTVLVASLLNVHNVGVDDNFFLLGGNSLLGAQVIARVRDAFGIELTLGSLFEHPTVSELSAEVARLLLAKVDTMGEHEARHLLSLASATADTDTYDENHNAAE